MEKLIPIFKFVHIFALLYAIYSVYTVYSTISTERDSVDQELATAQQEKESKEKEYNDLQSFVKDVDAAKENIKKVAEELDALRRKLPSDNSDVATIEVIQKIVKDINLQDVDLKPEPNEQNMGFYLIRNINFKATGTYLQFLLLMESIGNNERIFNMPKVTLTKSAKAQRGRFQLVDVNVLINTYRYNPDYTEDTGIQKIEEEFKNSKNKNKGKNKKKEESTGSAAEE